MVKNSKQRIIHILCFVYGYIDSMRVEVNDIIIIVACQYYKYFEL